MRRSARSPASQRWHPEDFFPTPPAAVRPFLRELDLPGGAWLEPAAGDGGLAHLLAQGRTDVKRLDLVELRKEAEMALILKLGGPASRRIECPCNYLTRPAPSEPYDLAITNPPYAYAAQFVAKMLAEARMVVCLLRLSFLQAQSRADFLREHTPDVYVLPARISFTGKGHDMSGHAWMVWRRGVPGGRLRILPREGAPQLRLAGGAR